jgi:hypothetical protein
MKYLLFWEQKEMPTQERQGFSRRARVERGDEEKYGVEVLPPHYIETGKGVTVVEIHKHQGCPTHQDHHVQRIRGRDPPKVDTGHLSPVGPLQRN